MEIFIILACVPLYVLNSFCDKIVSLQSGNRYNYIYNCLKFLICTICMVPTLFAGEPLQFAWGSLLCGAACGLFYAVSKTAMLKGYAATSVAFMTLCHSSGMILPCILGHFLWSEKLNLVSICGICITIFAIVLLKETGRNGSGMQAKGVIWGILIFLTSAGVMIIQKVMGLYFADQNIGLYNLYSFIVAAGLLCFRIKPVEEKGTRRDKKMIRRCAIGSAVSLSVISFVMTWLAADVPSVILFPLFNGAGIILVCVGSVFAFGERLNFKKVCGLVLGILGLYSINL